jgi:hypothetical protein
MAQQNSMLTTMVAGEKDTTQGKSDRIRKPDREKSVRFDDRPRKYKSPSRNYRQSYSSAESEGSGAETSENEANSDHDERYGRSRHDHRESKYNNRRERSDNRNSHGSRRDSRYDITHQMTKMMPVVAAMADITQRGRYTPKDQYGTNNAEQTRQDPQEYEDNSTQYDQGYQGRGKNNYNRGNYRGNSYDNRGRGRGNTYNTGNQRYPSNTTKPARGCHMLLLWTLWPFQKRV